MKKDEMLTLHRNVMDAWNSHDTEKFAAYCDPQIEWRDPDYPAPLKGVGQARDFSTGWLNAFPDLKINTLNTVVGDNTIVAELEFTGTHKGALVVGENRHQIDPTHKKVKSYGCYVATVKDGKYTSVHTYPDRAGLMMQLGILDLEHA